MFFSDILLILAGLLLIVFAFFLGRKIGEYRRERFWRGEVQNHRRDAVLRSRAVLAGQFSEQMAPYLPGFDYSPNECKFLGSPVDFLVFKGSDNKEIEEVVFVEVKKGSSKLNKQEKGLKKAIENKKVSWREFRVD